MLPHIYINPLVQGPEYICQKSNLVLTKLTSNIYY